MKKLLRKLARRFFQDWIKVYQCSSFISAIEVVQLVRPDEVRHYIKSKIAREISAKILEDGLIDFEEEDDPKNMGKIIRAKIRVI